MIKGYRNHNEFTTKKEVVDKLMETNSEIRIEWFGVDKDNSLTYKRGIAFKVESGKVYIAKLVRLKEFDPITVGVWEEFDTDGKSLGWSCIQGEVYRVYMVKLPE